MLMFFPVVMRVGLRQHSLHFEHANHRQEADEKQEQREEEARANR